MNVRLLTVALLLVLGAVPSADAQWKPAAGPLMTRWAKDVSPDKVHPEYPRPQMVRKDWLSLNGVWQLAIDKTKADEGPLPASEFAERILVPFPVESALSGVMKRADRLWYRRTFTVPKAWAGKRVLLHFGAVDWATAVYVNDTHYPTHRGGYDPFSFDITDALKPEGEQVLTVAVYDQTDAGPQPRGKQVRKPGGIYYTPTTGIWQTVWLEPVPAASIESLKIVPDVDRGGICLTVKTRGEGQKLVVECVVQEGGRPIANFVSLAGKPIDVPVANAKLWSPESPFLYDLQVSVRDDKGNVVDAVSSYFGMRKTSLGKDDKGVTRLFLNNKPYFQVGPLDQGFWPDGLYTAPTDEALKYDIEITKKLGFNMARKHVKVEPARWYYWCDKLGLLVWQDMPSGDGSVAPGKGEITRTRQSAQIYETELKAMIDNLHNYPCIVMWVVFNEGWGQFDTKRITEWTKKYDPSRLVDCASGWNDMQCGDVHDIHVYPGPGVPPTEPDRAAVLGEFGGLGLGIDGHTWAKRTWGYRGTADSADLTRKYERLLAGVWRLKEERGLAAAVYTQTTDVETEANGLLTYDREVIKVDLDRIAAVNRGDLSRVPKVRTVVPDARTEGLLWRYTLTKPTNDWFKVDFDAGGWKEAPGGFGTKGTPGAVVRTEWKTNDIWLRREFTLPDGPRDSLYLFIHHDEDADVYLNGVLAARLTGFTTDYEEASIRDEARATLKPGKNVIAIYCKQTGGGQYIDAGLVEAK